MVQTKRTQEKSDSCGKFDRNNPLVPIGSRGNFFGEMPYQPTKEHLDKQIPETFKTINDALKELRSSTGADARYISLMLDALAREWENKSPSREGFGFR